MSEEDLELLITLDDPEGAPEDDIFNHVQANNVSYWLDRQFAASRNNETMQQVKVS